MGEDGRDDGYWRGLDELITRRPIVIDRPRGSRHPRYPTFTYPLDYGYLEGTRAVDGQAIDVWVGDRGARRVDGVACTVDLNKDDAEVKLLVGCTPANLETIRDVHNNAGMHAIVVARTAPVEEGR
jgi:inorganic pyrophosphatase